jgi:hypothetical protein
LPPSEYSIDVNPVTLPPGCATLATKPPSTGSTVLANTTGMDRVARQMASMAGVGMTMMASGLVATNAAAATPSSAGFGTSR